ncbi:MAG: sugar phosphorylase [Puniceicoccales bacterium]
MKTVATDLSKVQQRLEFVYGTSAASEILDKLVSLIERYAGLIPERASGWSQKDALLITYGDSITGEGPPLATLHRFLKETAGELLSYVHLLPFYPFTSDDGFSVVDFRVVREDLGDWTHLEAMADDYRLVYDGVINHVSAASDYMKGYSAGDPDFADFFLSLDPEADTSSVLRTRNLPLLHDYETCRGPEWLWTTFSRDQLDLNYGNPKVLLEILDVLLFYAMRGASMIRLDAIPYLWKELGTSCAHLPQTHELIKLMRDVYDIAAPHVQLLTETNVPHLENVRYFGKKGDEAQMIYNFSLAPLIVWSLFKGDASTLTRWAKGLEYIGPKATYLNITATHDGIGMRPTEGILSEAERAEMVQMAYDRGGGMTGKRNGDGTVSPYELNLAYFDAINDPKGTVPIAEQVQRFMVSQAIPMALMGIPGIYIHSLLGSRNHYDGVAETGRARSINREQLDERTLMEALGDDSSLRAMVFTEYRKLLRCRQGLAALHPDATQEIIDGGSALFAVKREDALTGERLLCLHNVSGESQSFDFENTATDAISGQVFSSGENVIEPYAVLWLKFD